MQVTSVTSGPSQPSYSYHAAWHAPRAGGAATTGGSAHDATNAAPKPIAPRGAGVQAPEAKMADDAHVSLHVAPQSDESTPPATPAGQSTRHPPSWQNSATALTSSAAPVQPASACTASEKTAAGAVATVAGCACEPASAASKSAIKSILSAVPRRAR
jgi:hypothetical protein